MAETATSWVSTLNVLPAKMRLEVQKTITSDIVSQSRAGPQPPLSRAYASCNSSKLAAQDGLGVPASGLDGLGIGRRPTGPGHHLSAVQRTFPSTSAVLAELMLQAGKRAGVKPRVPFGGGSPVEAVGKQEAQLLEGELRACGLDTAYRVTLARSLHRSLSSSTPGPTASGSSATTGTTTPAEVPQWKVLAQTDEGKYAALEAAASGRLAELAQAAFEQQQQKGGAKGEAGGPSLAPPAPAAGTGDIDLDAMLDDALDEVMG